MIHADRVKFNVVTIHVGLVEPNTDEARTLEAAEDSLQTLISERGMNPK
jgi:hypothetical protein